jgi:hypothetical protein
MQHIDSVRIAALADEPASLVERSHLSECAACNAELASAQRVIRMAMTDTPAIERPITSWDLLGPALRAEGLVRTPLRHDVVSEAPVVHASRLHRSRWLMQAAAGLALAAGGAVAGRASVPLPDELPAAVAAADTTFDSTTEAMEVAQRASEQYERAVGYLAINDSSVTLSGRDAAELLRNRLIARLDAFDQSVAATRAALYRAPQDPVLNSLYMQSVGARNSTLRQMGQVMPVSSTTRTRF